MHVQSLYVYPVKSLPGIAVEQLALDQFGPAGDRRWMITDDYGNFISQRSLPKLAKVRVRIEESVVFIGVPGYGEFPLEPGRDTRNVMVWDDWLGAISAKNGPAQALSQFCSKPLDIVYMPNDSFRAIDRVWVKDRRRVGFADGFPFLIVNQSSLDELNERLEIKIDMRRFRPNIVVSGAAPWAEDQWAAMTIGAARFDLVKPCSRCVMTTVDPVTGSKAADQQPLRTLGSYRMQIGGVIFGMNAIHEGSGPVTLGDAVRLDEMGKNQ
ncbi:MOSC domain-containing protein [Marinobacter caseinilyticus]|uniref:MOSC domain-containing protein n=1 Tax=Marinobacter caseinilyticus TaxID=2692195 RepID=UPI001409EF06|nr:MOSC N-terminal beta barrel domain-containing protein [Marinobacter caseinilyticus]